MDMTIYDYNTAGSIDGATNWLLIQPGNNSVAYNKINRNTFLGITGQPADISSSQTFTNKILDNTNTITLKDTLFTLQDNSDTTKQLQFQLSSLTTATTRTLTVPDRSSTIATLGGTQTFTGANAFTGSSWSGGTIDNTAITVDTISGHTTANTGTVYGLSITSGTIATAGITDSAITPNKLLSGTGTSWTYGSWNLTPTGYSGTPSVYAHYIQIGKTVILEFSCTGTSNATSTTIQLPIAPKANATYTLFITDNSSVATSPGQVQLTGASLTANVYKTMASGAWTSSGTKAFFGFGITYEAN